MSQQAIRGALQTQLMTLGWTAQTAFEGRVFVPVADVPYQEVLTNFREPMNYSIGSGSMEWGEFMVRLLYPVSEDAGIGAQTTRAEAIRALFVKNSHLPAIGTPVVKISRRPSITRAPIQGDRDVTIVMVRFTER